MIKQLKLRLVHSTSSSTNVHLLFLTNSEIFRVVLSQMVKNLPALQETWVQSLGREDSLKKEIETHSSIHAWKILWMQEPGRLQSMGPQRVGHDWAISLSLYIGKRNIINKAGKHIFSVHMSKYVHWNIMSKKCTYIGTSLVVQWLRIHCPFQGTCAWSLGGN